MTAEVFCSHMFPKNAKILIGTLPFRVFRPQPLQHHHITSLPLSKTLPSSASLPTNTQQPWKTNAASSSICQFPFPLSHPPPTPSSLTVLLCSYVPRKCSATNRIITAKDHAAVQISLGKVDENGRYTGENQVYALCGFVRAMGESDDCVNRLAQKEGFLKGVWSASR